MISYDEFIKLKQRYRGSYQKFNTEITRFYLRDICNYNYLLKTVGNFSSLENFLNFHFGSKKQLIDKTVDLMYKESTIKGFNFSKTDVYNCLMVRLCNAYSGTHMERLIIKTLNELDDYITCEKVPDKVDMEDKVDCIVTLNPIGQTALQIKTSSFPKYDKGTELPFHKAFFERTGISVHYLLYDDYGNIIIEGKKVSLDNKKIIVEILINLVNS